ncbi:monovalent cation/H(+) antiporter subunit G [Trueperella pecoris]|uniref:Monovalent cation/H(+) antiporter subunit G n=1 Tax=Trueperella pecoris TaxID=2733571 RepID=A0A7M1QWW2_9ACTO|nr:monovalent cation/H(+) antiporter subunit G [Trueperella pecoris]QOQ39551.1 monovalent cation/H(+) antiporter subunit G [Trueperella pecoris]QOR45835.1 monovalent cation/H(+) antiporter subunit G [Trueperella pecoris]QTG75665.1 monovalent cation/H(+) antiporter subunit G [Trueperella pecoris]
MEQLADYLGVALIAGGSIFTFIAAIGAYRYPDLLARQHVATKPQVLSLIMLMLGVCLMVQSATMTWTMMLVIGFQLITSPISAHMLSRAGYRTGRIDKSALLIDELGEDMKSGDDRA